MKYSIKTLTVLICTSILLALFSGYFLTKTARAEDKKLKKMQEIYFYARKFYDEGKYDKHRAEQIQDEYHVGQVECPPVKQFQQQGEDRQQQEHRAGVLLNSNLVHGFHLCRFRQYQRQHEEKHEADHQVHAHG